MDKKDKAYHHGNLKNEMIEAGLKYIDEHGVDDLSMRKLADICGVSSAAPYAHFENKQAFIDAVQEHITNLFTSELQKAIAKCKDPQKILLDIGVAYVMFFYKDPLYYSFLFAHGTIDLKTYPPYLIFTEIATKTLEATGTKEEDMRNKSIALWSMVHGLSGIALMKGVVDKKRIRKDIEGILGSIAL